MADSEEMDLGSLLGLGGDDVAGGVADPGATDDDYGMSLDDLLAMENSSLMDVINIDEEDATQAQNEPQATTEPNPSAEASHESASQSLLAPQSLAAPVAHEREEDDVVELLSFDDDVSDDNDGKEPQGLSFDFLDEGSDLLPRETAGAEDIALTTQTEQEEFQFPIISELQDHEDHKEKEGQINLITIFSDGGGEATDSTDGHVPDPARDDLSLFSVPDGEDDAFVLPQVIPDEPPTTQSASNLSRNTAPATDDIELLFAKPPETNSHMPQQLSDIDFAEDYIGHTDNPRRSRKGIATLVVSSLALIGLAAGGFAAYSSHLPSTVFGGGNAGNTSSATSPGTSDGGSDTSASDQGQSDTQAKSALTEQSFVVATKDLGAKTAVSVPSSKDSINRAIDEADKSLNDESMSRLIDEIVNATKAQSPAAATSNKGSQILSVKASKNSKGLVFVVTSTGEMDLSVTVNVDGQVFQFPTQSSTGIATFVYDEAIPASGGYAYVVTSGSQEVSAVRSY